MFELNPDSDSTENQKYSLNASSYMSFFEAPTYTLTSITSTNKEILPCHIKLYITTIIFSFRLKKFPSNWNESSDSFLSSGLGTLRVTLLHGHCLVQCSGVVPRLYQCTGTCSGAVLWCWALVLGSGAGLWCSVVMLILVRGLYIIYINWLTVTPDYLKGSAP